MTVQSMYGLKEWDAQVQLLLSGQYAVLVRKGGIIEKNLEFEIEHREFFLYPTFLHQNKLELKEEHHPLILDQNPPSEVAFSAFARVRAVWKIEDLDVALQIEKLQALNSKAIERRFNYRNKPYLHVLLLEVFSLETSFVLTETPEMFGCISWVPLDQVHEVHARPVLPGQQLEALHQQLVDLLGAPQS
ncbi:DUF1802 family protein [Deinococcus cellulosilyticus]|uniref:DUF1802 family protein n=1 Tax=Deinococcus cellulosilyticus (strain DSM 18568 / NBRC 106333 / KACC 11606 / 5516J-15) TaxID=1223518 RepID=A0A511N0X9_DEIC1|nr:DUF1802 family protein [Deinococcus cellulosilyticus]GEM46522.1 hypothetical protein DC3_21570 [Deinococcus cellulosilyticus NBRC 106333 = KACC 11606]